MSILYIGYVFRLNELSEYFGDVYTFRKVMRWKAIEIPLYLVKWFCFVTKKYGRIQISLSLSLLPLRQEHNHSQDVWRIIFENVDVKKSIFVKANSESKCCAIIKTYMMETNEQKLIFKPTFLERSNALSLYVAGHAPTHWFLTTDLSTKTKNKDPDSQVFYILYCWKGRGSSSFFFLFFLEGVLINKTTHLFN